MSIRIRQIETRIIEHPLKPDLIVVSHAGKHDVSRFLVVTVHGDDGLKGYGEAATLPLWSGESAETAREMVEHCFAPRLIGNQFDHPREALGRPGAVELEARLFGRHGEPFGTLLRRLGLTVGRKLEGRM